MADADVAVFALLVYLLGYLGATVWAFGTATDEQIHGWAHRDSRGTLLQRYLLGTAPGPGASLFIASIALVVAVLWLPEHAPPALQGQTRVLLAVLLVAVAWFCVLVSFAVTFHADNIVEDSKALDFPDETHKTWSDYMYFAISVMTTFGTTDVNVQSADMRKTVSFNAIIAFIFNTVTVATLVSAIT
nr:DUF1345 domain-containing protein [Flexivirga meconopsidis]